MPASFRLYYDYKRAELAEMEEGEALAAANEISGARIKARKSERPVVPWTETTTTTLPFSPCPAARWVFVRDLQKMSIIEWLIFGS